MKLIKKILVSILLVEIIFTLPTSATKLGIFQQVYVPMVFVSNSDLPKNTPLRPSRVPTICPVNVYYDSSDNNITLLCNQDIECTYSIINTEDNELITSNTVFVGEYRIQLTNYINAYTIQLTISGNTYEGYLIL